MVLPSGLPTRVLVGIRQVVEYKNAFVRYKVAVNRGIDVVDSRAASRRPVNHSQAVFHPYKLSFFLQIADASYRLATRLRGRGNATFSSSVPFYCSLLFFLF